MSLRSTAIAALTTLALLAPLTASAQSASDQWTFSVTPYLWLPSIKGDLNYGPPPAGGGSANVSLDASTLLDNLDHAFMINGEARQGRWLIGTDVIYLDFGKADSTVRSVDFNAGPGPINVSTTSLNAGTNSKLTGWLWTLVGGYAAVQQPRSSLDLIGGFRYLNLDAKTDWQLTADVTGPAGTTSFARTGSVSKSEDALAGIVGAKGRSNLGAGDWFVNYYVDVGGGSSTFTWQGIAGLGYAFKWGDVILDYRYLYYSQSGDKLIDNLSLGGFALGARFNF
jgi:opacity protein-like surface antigen